MAKYSWVGAINLLLGLTQSFTALFFVSSVLGRLQVTYQGLGLEVKNVFVLSYILMLTILLSGIINLIFARKLLSLTPHEMSAFFRPAIFFALFSFLLVGFLTAVSISLALVPLQQLG